jgi:dTDP-4-amino-4,6-dideoxygalactose transaminase
MTVITQEIPLVDLKAQYATIRDDVRAAIDGVLDSICYAIRVTGGRRDALRAFLTERGIGTQIHYPVPIHMQEAAQFLGYRKGDLPVTEKVAGEVLSLPMYPELTDAQIDRVAAGVTEFMRKKS